MGVVLGTLGIGAVAVGAVALALEAQYRRRPGNALDLTPGDWQIEAADPQHYRLVGDLELRNHTKSLEIMVPELWAETKLLSKGSLAGLEWSTVVTPQHRDEPARPDDYWFAYIVKVGKTTRLKITLDITGADLSQLQSAWVKVNYVTYGPGGRIPKVRHVIIPLHFPTIEDSSPWQQRDGAEMLCVKTHLLTPLDKPVEVVKRYVMPHAKPGDVLTIGETPIAIMQGRMRHPSEVKPGWLARRICYYFHPTSSLATAVGMQTLVDISGPWRVAAAFVLGSIARMFGHRGGFYQLAGEQARLIDDVTGTLPPYEQFIVLGPEDPQAVVDEIKRETGLPCAIVDVNDLRRVKILASTTGVSQQFLEDALRSNPAGNADEQTPVVLLRPLKAGAGAGAGQGAAKSAGRSA
ncbi:MAG: F420-0:Gamma-glutamyl ligase [Synechococcales cyanobacterium RM1_1_8]|nr:F420-0:Gamma-glutamyl ligase [Synechococcales cyanobacterium RM1_1_8]